MGAIGFVQTADGVRVIIPTMAGLTWVIGLLAALAVGLVARFVIKLIP